MDGFAAVVFALCALPAAAQTEWRLPAPPDLSNRPSFSAMPSIQSRIGEALRRGLNKAPSRMVRLDNLDPRSMQSADAVRPCAIPLTNMLRPADPVPPSRRIQPPPAENLPMREVRVPAPSCDDINLR